MSDPAPTAACGPTAAGWLLSAWRRSRCCPGTSPQNVALLAGAAAVSFGGGETASGLVQAAAPRQAAGCGSGCCGLAAGRRGVAPAGRSRAGPLAARRRRRSALVGAAAPAASRSARAAGRSSRWPALLRRACRRASSASGSGGALALLALLMLLGAGMARLGYFRGDVFVAGAVVLCCALLLLVRRAAGGQGAGRRLPRRDGRALSPPRWPSAWATSASGAWLAWPAACAAAWPGTRCCWR